MADSKLSDESNAISGDILNYTTFFDVSQETDPGNGIFESRKLAGYQFPFLIAVASNARSTINYDFLLVGIFGNDPTYITGSGASSEIHSYDCFNLFYTSDIIGVLELVVTVRLADSSSCAAYKVTAMVTRISGVTAVSTPIITTIAQDLGLSTITFSLEADSTENAIGFRATGIADTDTEWKISGKLALEANIPY